MLVFAVVADSSDDSKAQMTRFSGELLKDDSAVLVQVAPTPDNTGTAVIVNVSDMLFGGHVLDAVKKALS